MKVRQATEADHDKVMAIQAENPDLMTVDPMANRINGPVFVAEDDNGTIVGVAIGRLTCESFMYLRPSLSPFQKAKAIKGLAKEGFGAMGDAGICEVHVFTTDSGFAKLCEKLPGAHADSRFHLWVNTAKC